ncbi:hypothetical protein TrVE_jg944 [Triparma verrucosa]|uniref:Uncharacterized protein n=1 Tax=Triparma verrucosa TaxID=1606542 RepID=A0A9W7FFV7_9STRA|nr:hypothetical protein TrVE_jg944 [Triparma verrucosa]
MTFTDRKARAEQKLLGSLGKPREFHNKSGYGKATSSSSVLLMSSDDSTIDRDDEGGDPFSQTKVDLDMAKRQKRAMRIREQQKEIEEVAILQSDPMKESVKHTFSRLASKMELKRSNHDKAYKTYRASLRALSDEIEVLYVKEADSVKDLLGNTDGEIDGLFDELNKDEILEMKPIGYVMEMWESIRGLLDRRSAEVQQFADNLESFEVTRSTTLAQYLREMVDLMATIGLQLPQEIERVAEIEAFELNSVITGNRRAHAELNARMEKEDIMEQVRHRADWEARLSAWRQLRHDRAIKEFHRDITADNFMNPPDRVALFESFKKEQVERHDRRCDVLAKLGRLNNDDLASELVNNIRVEFSNLNAEELKGIKQLYDSLVKLKHAKQDEAEKRREDLRHELHKYGALHLEPDTEFFANQMEEVVQSPELEEFMRKSGGLKAELVKIVKLLRDPNMIYQKVLDQAIVSLTVVQCGRDLEETLELQGKSSLRKMAQDTLERLRKATKSECLPILPLLKEQCTALALVNGIDSLLKKELTIAADGLQELVSTAEHAAENGGGTKTANTSKSHTATTDLATATATFNSTAGGGSTAQPPTSKAPSEAASKRSNRSSRKRSVSVAPSKGWEEPEIDMLAVRAIQKQVGMLLASCDLADEFKEVLADALSGMGEKKICNERIDASVFDEVTEPIKQRSFEQESLIDWAEQSLSSQSVALNSGAEKLCSFYHGIAVILERHREKELQIDDDASEIMFNLKEDFRLANDVREADEAHALDRLRHAADDKELEENFAKALELLDLIESEYRVYHTTATHAAMKHPVVTDDEHRHFTFMLCSRFGLVPPKEMVYPTESLEIVEKPKEQKTVAVVEPADQTADLPSAEDEKKDEEVKEAVGGEEEEEELTEEEKAAKLEAEAEAKLKAEEEAEAEAKRALKPKTAEELWSEGTEAEYATEAQKYYTYGIKIQPAGMVGEMLAPPVVEDEEEETIPQPFPTPVRTVKTEEELAAEEEARLAAEAARLEEEEKAKKSKKKGKKAAKEEEPEEEEADLDREPEFFDDFVLKPDEEIAAMPESERNAYIEEHDNRFFPLSQEEIDKLSDETFAVYEKVVAEVNVRRAIKARIMVTAKEKANSQPEDKDGNMCVEITLFPVERVTSYVEGLRESLLGVMEDESQKRRKVNDDLCEERKEDLTEELEERLRLHWPRKGRTEVKYRQPREGELVAHRQKSARFLRQFYKRLGDQNDNYNELSDEVTEHANEFVNEVNSLKATLKDQGSLAALQGVEMRCKKLLANFKPECEDYHDMLNLLVTVEPQKLANSITELLRLTKTFPNGGDYDIQEVNDLKELLVEPQEKLDAVVEERRGKIVALQDYEVEAMQVTKSFKVEYEKCLQELSLREGLGKKYGAPRRNAQERLRTEVTRDEYSANRVDDLLTKLEKLCEAAKKGKAVKFEGEEDGEEALPLAVRIKHVTLSVRGAVFRRAKYLEFLREGAEVGAEDEIPADMEETGAGAAHVLEDAMVVGTFEQAIKTLQKQCKEETYALYAGEGKTDLLGDSGVPESLAKWLDSNNIKVLGPEGDEILNEATIVTLDGINTYCVKYVGGLEEKNVSAVLIREYGTQPVRAPEPPVFREGTRVQVHFQCHREKSRRRLRSQIMRLETIIAKTPIPPNPAWLGAPSAAVTDSMRRAARKSDSLRTAAEAGFKKLLKAWEAARKKHVVSLRPQLGSPDAAEELAKLVKKEAKRGEEVRGAVRKFKTKLLETEAENARDCVERLTSVLLGWAAILDKMVLKDDLLPLPGDELILPKRKSLKRLRKVANKGGGGGDGGEEGVEGIEVGVEVGGEGGGGGGRQWGSRVWDVVNLDLLAVEMEKDAPPPPELTEEEVAAKEKEKAAATKKGKGKKGAEVEEEEGGDDEGLGEIAKWAKEKREAAKFKSYVTTSHRCLVKTVEGEVTKFSEFFKSSAASIRERYDGVEKREKVWESKWKGMVEDLQVETQEE